MPGPPHRRALDPPPGELVRLERAAIDATIGHARQSPRGRVILPFHKREDEPLHRMLNAVTPASYIRPHRHLDPPKAEAFVVLRGALAFFTFEDDGRIRACVEVAADGEVFGVDLAPGVYHTFVALAPETVVYEVKTGPYVAATDKAFAPWAPPEDDTAAAAAFMARLREEHRRRITAGAGGP